jgi:6-phosphogluconolactonase
MAGPGVWRIFESAATLTDGAAEWLCALALAGGPAFSVCLSGGSTPRPLYERLAGRNIGPRFPWDRVHWFWGDERFVPHDDAASNYKMAHDALFAHVPVPAQHIHAIPTQGLSPQQAAVDYEATLQHFYGAARLDERRPLFDVTLLGVGENGHTASLFPGDPALQEARRWTAVVTGTGIPARITLTYPALNSSSNVAFLVTGANKKNILLCIRAGHLALPAARICPVGHLIWFADRAAMPE